MAQEDSTHLRPSLIKHGGLQKFIDSGKTLSVTVSPRDDSIAVYATSNSHARPSSNSSAEYHPIYMAIPHLPPSGERRTFLTDTSVIFAAAQNLVRVAREESVQIPDTVDGIKAMTKLALDYVNHCKECCIYAAQETARRESLQFDADHYRKLYTCFSLFMVLYMPEGGFEDAPVGDELMDWLNTHYIEPSTEDGDRLSSLDRPWEDETFWHYLTRATLRGLSRASAFFLGVLSQHPSPNLQHLSQRLIPLLTNHPRLHQFAAERDFAVASRRWKDKVKSLRLELDRVPEEDREDGFENWWERFSDIVSILEGRGDSVKRIVSELGGDWKEVCAVWSVFVDTRIRRSDLPDLVEDLLDELPPDPTNLEDVIHSSLFLGRPTQALSQAAELDIWLAAHLVDIMESLQLIDVEPDDSEHSIRDHYILSYAEYMRSDPSLWRLTVDYMSSCSEIGKAMADQVLMHVPLRLHRPKGAHEGETEIAQIHAGQLAGVLKEVIATCFEYKREEVRRMICRIAAQTFMQEKEYGLAVSYCASAEDWPGLGRVVDRVLEDYITEGPETFARLVANMSPVLHSLRAAPGAHGVFLHRLMFAVRFAEFHQRRMMGDLQEAAFDLVAMFREDLAPRSWWAVILSDAVELLQHSQSMLFTNNDAVLFLHKLQEIDMRCAQGAQDDYLAILARTMKGAGEKQIFQRLQVIRLVLARYTARCGVIGVGGRTTQGTVY
ncbi:hypothetical protein OBBRIDRAFT_753240 [Obba rivulosa]|uniref:Nuclear pore complex protein Nup85 n=1 Tax=Obba rivulosa TaxID=1052685 RepID=A0A8E2DNT7_9APHY|nr:hypothetical protein OBBRIDRAFT_753240 [Obba rivulosa]